MDYLTEAKTFHQRAKDARDPADKEAHLNMGIAMLEKAVRVQTTGNSDLNWAEKEVLRIFEAAGLGPNGWIGVQSIWTKWGARGSNDDMVNAIQSLDAKGLIRPNTDKTQYALTETGASQL